MLLFAHVGITTGIAKWMEFLTKHFSSKEAKLDSKSPEPNIWAHPDYRAVVVGSMLPDIIDKPVGMVLLPHIFGVGNGRMFSHTLLFVFVLMFIGIYLYEKRRNSWFIFLSFGSGVHLILDQMWLSPRTLFWPACGFHSMKFSSGSVDLMDWVLGMLNALKSDPVCGIPEAIGFCIVLGFGIWILSKRVRIEKFIRSGAI